MNSIEKLYQIILDRKENPTEGSYTCYLFDAGLDKILKKVGEESAEAIIAAKTSEVTKDNSELKEESCDLIFHLLVLLAERGIPLDDIEKILDERSNKIGNLKPKTASNPNS